MKHLLHTKDPMMVGRIAMEAAKDILQFFARNDNKEDLVNFLVGRISQAIAKGIEDAK